MTRSLAIAAAVGILGVFAFMTVMQIAYSPRGPVLIDLSSLWVLMPNLVALGLPPILIGTENEDRTFDWLRGLPVRWTRVLASKLIVAVTLWIASVLWATAMLLIVIAFASVLPRGWLETSSNMIAVPSDYVGLVAFGGYLLMIGTMFSLLLRHPIAAILVTAPTMFVLMGLVNCLDRIITRPDSVAQCFLAIGSLVLIGVLPLYAIAWLGRRRLAGPADESWRLPQLSRRDRSGPNVADREDTSESETVSGATSMLPVRGAAWWPPPSATMSLLWQQWRQTRWIILPAVGLSVVTLVSLVLSFVGQDSSRPSWEPLSVLCIGGAQLTLGVCCFFGDRLHHRAGFFAHRGVSPTLVWWTRCLSPWLASLVVMTLSWFAMQAWNHEHASAAMGLAVQSVLIISQGLLFAIGAAAGQWTGRVALSFFVAPLMALATFMVLGYAAGRYEDLLGWWALAIPVWWFATWHLTRAWMESRGVGRFAWRGLAYAALSVALVTAAVGVHRWASIPPPRLAWQSKMRLADPVDPAHGRFETRSVAPAVAISTAQPLARLENLNKLKRQLEQELQDPDWIGKHVSSVELRSAIQLKSEASAIAWLAIEVSLHWADVIRRRAVAGQADLRELLVAEWLEELALTAWIQAVDEAKETSLPNTVALRDRIISRALRRDSRRVTLIRAWQQFDAAAWWQKRGETYQLNEKLFAGRSFELPQLASVLERQRASRLIDEAVHHTLAELDGELPADQSQAYWDSLRRWEQAFSLQTLSVDQDRLRLRRDVFYRYYPLPVFTSDLDRMAARLAAEDVNARTDSTSAR